MTSLISLDVIIIAYFTKQLFQNVSCSKAVVIISSCKTILLALSNKSYMINKMFNAYTYSLNTLFHYHILTSCFIKRSMKMKQSMLALLLACELMHTLYTGACSITYLIWASFWYFILVAKADKLVRNNSLQRNTIGGWISKRNVQQSSHVEIKLGWRHYLDGENKQISYKFGSYSQWSGFLAGITWNCSMN